MASSRSPTRCGSIVAGKACARQAVSRSCRPWEMFRRVKSAASGERRAASGEWRVASGEWRVASGEWRASMHVAPGPRGCSLPSAQVCKTDAVIGLESSPGTDPALGERGSPCIRWTGALLHRLSDTIAETSRRATDQDRGTQRAGTGISAGVPPSVCRRYRGCPGTSRYLPGRQIPELQRKRAPTGSRWTPLDVELVELGGFEPPSASHLRADLHV
jgi:hypothetical protein